MFAGLGGFGTGTTSTTASALSLGSSTGFALSAPKKKTTASTGLSLGGFGATSTSASTGVTTGAAKPTDLTLGSCRTF